MATTVKLLFSFLLLFKTIVLESSVTPPRTRRASKLKALNQTISQAADALFHDGDIVRIVLNGYLFGAIGKVVNKSDESGGFQIQFKHSSTSIYVGFLRKIPQIILISIEKYNELTTIQSIQRSMKIPEPNTMLLLPIEESEYTSQKFLYVNGYLQDQSLMFEASSELLRLLQQIQKGEIPMSSSLQMDINLSKIINAFQNFISNADPIVLLSVIDGIPKNVSNIKALSQAQILIEMSNLYHYRKKIKTVLYTKRQNLLETESEWQAKNLKFTLLFNRLMYKCFDLNSLMEIVKNVLVNISYEKQNNYVIENETRNIVKMIDKCTGSILHCNKVVIYVYNDYIQRVRKAMVRNYLRMVHTNPAISLDNWVKEFVGIYKWIYS